MACVTFLALSNFLWSTLNDDGATTSASLGSEVDDVVGALDDIHIVLHNQNSVAAREETVEGGKEKNLVLQIFLRFLSKNTLFTCAYA